MPHRGAEPCCLRGIMSAGSAWRRCWRPATPSSSCPPPHEATTTQKPRWLPPCCAATTGTPPGQRAVLCCFRQPGQAPSLCDMVCDAWQCNVYGSRRCLLVGAGAGEATLWKRRCLKRLPADLSSLRILSPPAAGAAWSCGCWRGRLRSCPLRWALQGCRPGGPGWILNGWWR